MFAVQRYSTRLRRYFRRYQLLFHKRPKLRQISRIFLILIAGFLIINIINGVLFTTILFFQEDIHEPDYDLDTRPYYKTIELKKRFDSSGNYLIVQNFVQFQSNLTKNAHLLALNLHTNIQNLHSLLNHTKVWDGPISLSLYIKGARASDDIDYASIWLRCNRRLFKVLNVHLIMSAKAYERSISNQHNTHSVKYAVSCQNIKYINHTDETDSTIYPSNLLRNVARTGTTPTTVQYILTLDIDIYPAPDLFHHLVSFYTQIKTTEEFNRTLYVIPSFEIHLDAVKNSAPLPQNKNELILLWNDQHLQPFQADVCPTCQFLTNYQAWKQEASNDKIVPLFRPHYAQPWQPYYVGPKDAPTYDARFKAHAHARISQCCESYVAGYDFVVLNNIYLYRLGFLDKNMDSEETMNSSQTNLMIRVPSQTFKDRLKKCLGLPKTIHGDYTDNEQCVWPSNILLCATVFLEDAINYQSISHKVTRNYLSIYRWFASPLIKKLHQIILWMNLCLALFEPPSSFSITSDVRDQPNRITFPYYGLLAVEGVTLLWFLAYICTKFRLRRIFRPIFMIESSQLMKKVFKAVHQQSLTIIACITLTFIHVLFFAVMAMYLFPKSDIRPDSQNTTYFDTLHNSVFELLVLYSTANNPDIMMPAYSDRRLNSLFFIVFVIIGIYWLQNIITAVVYRAFRGYFLNAIINSLLRRRTAVQGSFEILKKRVLSNGSIETKDTIPISLVQAVLESVLITKWHFDLINHNLNELQRVNEAINLEQYSNIMRLLDLNPRLAPDVQIQRSNENLLDRLKAVGRSKAFDLIGTIFAILSVLLVTIEVGHRHLNTNYRDVVTYLVPLAYVNLSFMIYFVLEILIKAWAYGPGHFFRSSTIHVLEATVALSCLILQAVYMGLYKTPLVLLVYTDFIQQERSVFTLWAAIKTCNMLFIYRLIRFLPASKNIRIIVGTVFDEVRNGGAFFGVLFSCYYAYSLLGMELFGGAIGELYKRSNISNQTVCGSYQQLEYWSNGFDDFYSSMVTLYHIMVVNQWFVFVNGFREATNSKWSELYFIFWYLFVTNIGLNICLALSGDIHDAKKKRADQQEELIVSNMYDIYRADIKEPSPDQIVQRLNQHPYINFLDYTSDRFIYT
ncbi:unnamed protein product [Adineta ricciae]|uniref:Ion transport domain-containing protein n=1 Tax=Adineta ricciae TaxID=249248 RepID=A0A815VPM6_ADIRI|nr:unnamed protein product [Adineta ricciae]